MYFVVISVLTNTHRKPKGSHNDQPNSATECPVSKCLFCPEGTVSNDANTECKGMDISVKSNQTYILVKLTVRKELENTDNYHFK